MNSAVVVDTNAILWWYFDPSRLSAAAQRALSAAASSGRLLISAITLVELVYLEGRAMFPYPGAYARLSSLAADPVEPLEVLPVTAEVADAMHQIPRAEVPDMPDRIIGATAVAHHLPMVSADTDLRNSASLNALVSVIW
jgi:PIN domain nuclease of toxin-antitoxin system